MGKDTQYFKKLLQKDIQKTVKELLEFTNEVDDNQIHNSLIMQSGRLNSVNNDNNMGILSRQDYQMEIARIRQALLYIIDQLSDSLNKEQATSAQASNSNSTRVKQLNKTLSMNYQLLSEWEEKRDLSENPKEKMRCDIEIKNIKETITKYESELKNLQ